MHMLDHVDFEFREPFTDITGANKLPRSTIVSISTDQRLDNKILNVEGATSSCAEFAELAASLNE